MPEPQIKDARGWSPVDYGYLDNPKMLDVLDASSIAALMHLASVLYCAQHLTDGHIAPGIARRKVGGTRDDDALLVAAGLWHEHGHDCPTCPQPEPGRVYVHDFLQHNRTAAKAKRVSERRSEAARARWAKTKADDAPTMQSALQDAVQGAVQNGDVCNAEREKEREIDTLAHPSGSARVPDRFPEWWGVWRKKKAKGDAAKAYKAALRKIDHDTLMEKTRAYWQHVDDTKTDLQYVPYPATWLRAEQWDDDLTSPTQPTQGSIPAYWR